MPKIFAKQTCFRGYGGVENGNISSISEGETSISYDNSNSSIARIQKLIDKLGKAENQLIGFRKVKW